MTRLLELLSRSPDDLTEREANELVCAVTDQLATHWLDERVIKKTKSHRAGICTTAALDAPPTLPDDRGICILLLACETDISNNLKMPALKPAIPFFVVWEHSEDGRHDPRLPPDLRAVADRVIDAVALDLKDDERLKNMTLQPPRIWRDDFPDFSCLPFTFASAFASLAAGLLVASAGGKSNLKVMASACWSEKEGFQSVCGLKEKAKLAARLECETLFVATNQRPKTLAESQLNIQRKLTNESNVLKASAAFRKELFVRPEKGDNFQIRREYYVDILRGNAQAKEFYREMLLEDVAKDCREFLREGGSLPTYEYGITWVSRTPELVLLMEAVYSPRKLLLLYTHRDKEIDSVARWLLEKIGPDKCELVSIDSDERMLNQVDNILEDKLRTVDRSLVVVDLTPGFRLLTIALLNAVPKGCRLSITQTDTNRTSNAALPGTERFVVWDKTTEPEELLIRPPRSMEGGERGSRAQSPSRLGNEPTAGLLG